MLVKNQILGRLVVLLALLHVPLFSFGSELGCATGDIDSASHIEGIGIAIDNRTGAFLYCEIHTRADESLRIIYYKNSNDKIFAKKTLTGKLDTSTPNVEQVNFTSGEQRAATQTANTYDLRFRQNHQAKVNNVTLELNEIDIIDAGFDVWIKKNWEELESKAIDVRFASPPHQTAFDMKIAKQSNCDDQVGSLPKTAVLPAQPTDCFTIKIKNRFLALLAPSIKLAYSDQRELLIFQGITNLASDEGVPFDATIIYQHFNTETLPAKLATHNQ